VKSLEVRVYIAAQPPPQRHRLAEMRRVIRAAVPKAEEGFSYRMPCFRLDGRILVWYAGFKAHTSLFPIGRAIQKALKAPLTGYPTSKGTVRFPLDRPLPVSLLKRLVKARLAELHETE
jgi:uncharacterized protein YdhG (YjbR/CyaY superfamily)